MKWFLRAIAFALFLIVVLAILLRVRYGGGEYYPDLSTPPLWGPDSLEVAATLEQPPGNLAVSADNRLFFNYHPESKPVGGSTVFEWVDGAPVPYPSQDFQSNFIAVLGMFIDQQNRLWTLDTGNQGLEPVRLLAFDLHTNAVVHDHTFPKDIAESLSFMNDLQVSSDGQTIYIADVSFWRQNPALVVYDIESKEARRLLEGHESVVAQDWIVRTDIKDMVFVGGLVALKPGVDGLALSKDDAWLYYGAMTHDGLYRVRTADLLDQTLDAATLGSRVERVGTKPLNDGLTIDVDNNVYITAVEHNGVIRMNPDGNLESLIDDDRVRWADGISYGGDGYIYFTDSAIPDLMLQSRAHIDARAPFYIYRFRADVEGVPGG
ncbi:MAG: L-dopachrome tautomerase-related protein [Bacteroidota bacterium]